MDAKFELKIDQHCKEEEKELKIVTLEVQDGMIGQISTNEEVNLNGKVK